ncbi:ATP-binding protein [Nakamurella lactea]|uniref:ATP-binding protein n=1 Tax=Nakamurella lactea TaxID=459515 RepID=UPI001B7FB855|nr:ATP-binding protein [Nakamurella lactea]
MATKEVLVVGGDATDPLREIGVLAKKLNRHTFWCGQSGSGKTYALGVLLEQIILHTALPVLVFDPNGDFVRLGHSRATASESESRLLAERDIRVLHSTGDQQPRLRVRFVDLDLRARAAVLDLDPLVDAEEYNMLIQLEREFGPQDYEAMMAGLRTASVPARRALALRVDNLGALEWDLWARGEVPAEEIIAERADATVLDLGGFRRREEPRIAALSVLQHLWEKRESRVPRLIVIDEAHNLCPPNPDTLVEKLLVEQIVQIAAEGRKYGLWLLLSTQRPSKVHPEVISQCDNIVMMKMNGPRDLLELSEIFGFVPREIFDRAKSFTLGQALVAGGFIEAPTVVRMRDRITEEPGGDISVPLRDS